jgi:hypothetical protein
MDADFVIFTVGDKAPWPRRQSSPATRAAAHIGSVRVRSQASASPSTSGESRSRTVAW